jgi:hypothetical protein
MNFIRIPSRGKYILSLPSKEENYRFKFSGSRQQIKEDVAALRSLVRKADVII